MYVWSTAIRMVDGRVNDGISDQEDQERLLRFCRVPEIDIRRLYVFTDPALWNEPSLLSFLRSARESRIDVYAVPRGIMQNGWIKPVRRKGRCDPTAILEWVDELLRFESRYSDKGFAGIQLDIEPHSAGRRRNGRPVWQNDRGGLRNSKLNRTISRQYLDLLDMIGARIEHSGLKLAATLPPWMDHHNHGESYMLRYHGSKKPLIHHVMDRVDFVTLMNYIHGSSSGNRARAWKLIEGEVSYGPTEVLLQTARPARGQHNPSRKTTLYKGGERLYREIREMLEKRFSGDSNYIGCGTHHYLDAYGSGQPGWPRHI